LSLGNALVLSVTALHGRGLQPSGDLTGGMRLFAAIEAVVGLGIEALLVAALVRRVTGAS
jgi:hypothetical protein